MAAQEGSPEGLVPVDRCTHPEWKTLQEYGPGEKPLLECPACGMTKYGKPVRVQHGDERDRLPETGKFPVGPDAHMAEVSLLERTAEEKKGTASPIHPIVLAGIERAADVYQMRIDGWSIREIATKYKINIGTVEKILKKQSRIMAKKAAETQDQIRQIHHERLENMYRWITPFMRKGHARSIDMGIKILERQAKLYGVDAPEKKQIEMTMDGVSDAELVEQAARLGLEIPEVLRVETDPPPPSTDAEVVEPIGPPDPPAPHVYGVLVDKAPAPEAQIQDRPAQEGVPPDPV